MSSVATSYEDTLRTLRTGKGTESSPLESLRKYMSWGRNNEVLPFAAGKDAAGPAPPQQSSSILSWPPWAAGSASEQPPFYDTFGLSMAQRYMAFGGCILGAVLMFFLAFVHLPLMILSPGKFVVPYCFGSIFLFASFGFLHGFYSYLKHLFSADRWPFSTMFILSTVATLYVAWWLKMYALTIPMALLQFVAMGAFVVSYLPGGTSGISMMGSLATSSIRSRMTGF